MEAETANPATKIRPPFTEETARAKVKAAEDGWNSRDPERVALAYSEDSRWRNRTWAAESPAPGWPPPLPRREPPSLRMLAQRQS